MILIPESDENVRILKLGVQGREGCAYPGSSYLYGCKWITSGGGGVGKVIWPCELVSAPVPRKAYAVNVYIIVNSTKSSRTSRKLRLTMRSINRQRVTNIGHQKNRIEGNRSCGKRNTIVDNILFHPYVVILMLWV